MICKYFLLLSELPCTFLLMSFVLMDKSFKFWSSPSYLFFSLVAFVVMSKKPPTQGSWRFTPMFSSKTFTVLALAFRYLIHFELIFVCGERGRDSTSLFCLWLFSYSNTICWKDYSFPIELSDTLVKNQLTINIWVYFWTLSSILWICICPYASTTLLIVVAL